MGGGGSWWRQWCRQENVWQVDEKGRLYGYGPQNRSNLYCFCLDGVTACYCHQPGLCTHHVGSHLTVAVVQIVFLCHWWSHRQSQLIWDKSQFPCSVSSHPWTYPFLSDPPNCESELHMGPWELMTTWGSLAWRCWHLILYLSLTSTVLLP